MALVIMAGMIIISIGCTSASQNRTPSAYSGATVSGELQSDWQKTNISRLELLLGQKLPIPTYLPAGYEIREVYYAEAPFSLGIANILMLISDQPIGWVSNKYTCRIVITISWNESGLGIRWLADKGESIHDGYGVLMQHDNENELWWPSYGSPQSLGSTLVFRASLQFGKDELIKIADSTPPPNPLSYPRQVSLGDANKILNADPPRPTYLPEKFSLTAIYLLEYTSSREEFALTFYPKDSIEGGLTNIDQAPIRMYVRLFRGGQVGGLKLVGDKYYIGGTVGILVTREESNGLWWIINYREFPGQYEIVLAATKDVPKEEIVKMAQSVPQSGWSR